MHRSSAALIAVALLLTIASSFAVAGSPPSAEDIFAKQQAYFNSIKSIEFYSTFIMHLNPEVTARMEEEGNPPRTKIEQGLQLFIEGDKFRAEATLTDFSTQQPFTAIHAFDGESYQLLYLPQEPSYPILMPGIPYLVFDPLTSLYSPAFPGSGEMSIPNLRGDAFWSLLADMVVACEPARIDDCNAVKLTLSVPSKIGEGRIPVEMLFAEKTGYAPAMTWRSVHTGPEAAGIGEFLSEMRIAATAPVETDAGTIHIPIRLESGTHRAGEPGTPSELIAIEPSTLKVNHDIDDSVFTIPSARVYRTLSAPPPETSPLNRPSGYRRHLRGLARAVQAAPSPPLAPTCGQHARLDARRNVAVASGSLRQRRGGGVHPARRAGQPHGARVHLDRPRQRP